MVKQPLPKIHAYFLSSTRKYVALCRHKIGDYNILPKEGEVDCKLCLKKIEKGIDGVRYKE